jgi:hypothetical protein
MNIILNILEKLPYKDEFGMSIVDRLKERFYWNIGKYKDPERCLCGGKVSTIGVYPDGRETSCDTCQKIYDED